MALSEIQRRAALDLLTKFKAFGMKIENQGTTYNSYREFDRSRLKGIPEIGCLLQQYIEGKIGLDVFKEKNDSLNRDHNYWGFTGFSGQMLLNQLSNWSAASDAMSELLRESLVAPEDKPASRLKIHRCAERLPRLVPSEKRLRIGSVPFFLSYFWQIQAPERIPVYYHASKKALMQLGFMEEVDDLGEAFVRSWDIHDDLAELYASNFDLGHDNRYWFVEHVLWHAAHASDALEVPKKKGVAVKTRQNENAAAYWEFVPPRLHDLVELANGGGDGNVFEKKVALAFQMLGFRVETLGQGTGRNPDGIAYCREHNFAILFDAKAHSGGYSIGRDDRSAIEYIRTHARSLTKEGYEKQFFIYVSGAFPGDFKPSLDRIRKETQVKSIVLLTADSLLRLLAKKIEDPRSFDLAEFEDLLLDSGDLSSDKLEAFWSN